MKTLIENKFKLWAEKGKAGVLTAANVYKAEFFTYSQNKYFTKETSDLLVCVGCSVASFTKDCSGLYFRFKSIYCTVLVVNC